MSDQSPSPFSERSESRSPGDRGPVLVGTRIRIRPIEWDDLEAVCRWWNVATVMREVRAERFCVSLERLQTEYWPAWRDQTPGPDGRCQCVFELLNQPDSPPIGEIGWSVEESTDFDREIQVHLKVCEPSLWGRGYGTEALQLLLGYLADHPVLGTYPVIGEPGDWNVRCHRMLEKCGFTNIGTGRFAGNAWCEPCTFVRYRLVRKR